MYKFYIVIALIAMHLPSHAKFKVTVLETAEPEVVIVPEKVVPKMALNLANDPTPQKQVVSDKKGIKVKASLPKAIDKSLAQVDVASPNKLPQKTIKPTTNIKSSGGKGKRAPMKTLGDAIVQGVRVWSSDDSTRAVFDLSAATDYKVERYSNPERIEIEFENSIIDGPLNVRRNNDIESIVDVGNGKLVMNLKGAVNEKHFMLAPFKNSGFRVVVDLKKPANNEKATTYTTANKSVDLKPRPSTNKPSIAPVTKSSPIKKMPRYESSPVAVMAVNDMSNEPQVSSINERPSAMIKEASLKPIGFTNNAGQKVEDILNGWASEANYTIKYNLGIWSRVKELTISISAQYGDQYTGAVESFLGDLNSTPQLVSQNVSLHGCMYMNKVIEITDKECGK